ncbi:OLC1v1013538C1 [Oldenlandia corymbosa var. corymbosa]|uniref:OLC1v1013538C1 n=1 Tax=Oldenlandia corymbosa var. corymbosa TaxID=529605 RepID=A0AAV1E122_OLDCO|nr:OLC1v1013538C1 [Oldenlandia corymbosa var. corymbosa]
MLCRFHHLLLTERDIEDVATAEERPAAGDPPPMNQTFDEAAADLWTSPDARDAAGATCTPLIIAGATDDLRVVDIAAAAATPANVGENPILIPTPAVQF